LKLIQRLVNTKNDHTDFIFDQPIGCMECDEKLESTGDNGETRDENLMQQMISSDPDVSSEVMVDSSDRFGSFLSLAHLHPDKFGKQ
jgi:hypothetical protein